jgi:Ca-activated chloride channel family protein
MRHAWWLSACLLAVAGSVVLGSGGPLRAVSRVEAAQSAGDRPEPVEFRSAADLVPLNVVVTDRHQQVVSGLTRTDFVVLEDGVPQTVSHFTAGGAPLDLAVLLDASGSMADRMPAVRAAARGFVNAVRGIDRVMVVSVKRATTVLQPLAADVPGALAAIESARSGGTTGLYNGLYFTLKELNRTGLASGGQVRRKAIVVLSDAVDTTSLLSFEDVLDVARGAGVAIYPINLRSEVAAAADRGRGRVLSDAEHSMKQLAQETGALAFFPDRIEALDGVYESIAGELGGQYSLAYASSNPRRDGAFRRISVQVADRPDVRARTRSGYEAPRPPRPGA